jgi:hypothetical protein
LVIVVFMMALMTLICGVLDGLLSISLSCTILSVLRYTKFRKLDSFYCEEI